MSYKIKNNSNYDLSRLTSLVQEYYPYARKSMGFNVDPTIIFESDMENAQNPLGKTAYYNPSDYSVTIYVDNRHPKDIMRSLNHELVHHKQNCAGKFENLGPTEEGYAQSDPYLREMEEEAYKDMTFRDWENQKNIKEKKTMKLTEEKLRGVIREAIQKALGEQSKTDSPDRVAGRDAGGRRLDEEDEETISEEEEIEEAAKPDFLDLDKDGDKEEPMKDASEEAVEEIISPEMATSVEHDPEIVQRASETLELVAAGRLHLPASVVEVLGAVAAAADAGPGRIGPEDLAEEKDKEKDEEKKQEDEFGSQLAGAQSGVNEDVKESFIEDRAYKREDRPKEDDELTEEEEVPLKEWYEGSLYGRLLKEYTKKR